MKELFRKFAHHTSEGLGSPIAFVVAVLIVVAWALTGPAFQFSETWQLVINTGTTIITFLMVFVIQNTQNRDIRAQQLKLDELLRAVQGARNSLIDLEELSDEQLAKLAEEFRRLQLAGDDAAPIHTREESKEP
jgi:low affinity Fe/Cu permease